MPLTRGFTADFRPAGERMHKGRQCGPALAVAAVLLMSIVLFGRALAGGGTADAVDSTKSQPSVVASPYLWRVYMLNQSSVLEQPAGTAFSFRAEDLPFSFESILFGDFRADIDHKATYYGGCGILVNASGTSASVVLKERSGKFIDSVPYTGQELIVFSGERESVSYPIASTSYQGTDRLIEDWRNGTWSPSDGIMIEHPGNVAVTECVFCLMVFEPEGGVMIPEFSQLPTSIILILVAMIIVRRSGHGRKY